MLTTTQIRAAIAASSPVTIAVLGDSTTAGICCNSYPNVWTNGYSYGCVNLPDFSPNLVASSSYFINLTTYPSQPQQDNVLIPSAVRLLRTYIESLNASARVYNFGISGADAAIHITAGTVAIIAAKTPKPDVVLINLGINSAKNNVDQTTDLQTLITQVLAANMQAVLVIPNNVGVAYTAGGIWVAESTPDQWVPMDNWPATRNGIKALAGSNSLEYIDLGSDDGVLDITGLYDAFHPNSIGYQRIANIYKAWTKAAPVHTPDVIKVTGSGSLKFRDFPANLFVADQGALRVLQAHSTAHSLSAKSAGALRFITSHGIGVVT